MKIMKRLTIASIVILTVLTNISSSAIAANSATEFKKPVQPGTLSEADITALKQSFTDEKTQRSWIWSGSFTQSRLSTADAARAKSQKKIPYRITGALYEIKEINGKKTSKRESGTCWMFIKDAEGNIIHKTSQSLGKMCPS